MSLGRDKPTNQVDSTKNMMTQNMVVKEVSISLDDAPYSDDVRTAMSAYPEAGVMEKTSRTMLNWYKRLTKNEDLESYLPSRPNSKTRI